jgi:ADP-ribosylglycohydrolase
MPIPADYPERVYAGVLGKLIGVYLGRPFEGWSHERILAELGEILYYVHERRGVPLVVTDDDLSGTFTFLRALEDYGATRNITPAQIGQTWLNYIIERRTILWWGGMGNSTEHTAYLRLKSGVPAPASGSIARNGKVVAEQIGAQIFIDGWAMVAPGDPELAADLARRAASVSHDGEAIFGAQVIAAMEAQAFTEPNLDRLLDCGLSFIPHDSVIYRMICDIRDWHAVEPDWRVTRQLIAANYGYDKYGGNCHIVPNHGLIIHALLHGENDFQRSLMIVNTCGWDTDCNSGNVGCLLGIKNGLAGIDAGPDYRGPVADRLYLPTADGGRGITDALTEAYRVVNIGRALVGEELVTPRNGARFHFSQPGSVQGWQPDPSPETAGTLTLTNAEGRSLALPYHRVAPGRPARAATATFIPLEAKDMSGYGMYASPTLYSGQTVHAHIESDPAHASAVACTLFASAYNAVDTLDVIPGPTVMLEPGAVHQYQWTVPDTGGQPIMQVGLEITAEHAADGTLYLDHLTWDGTPTITLGRPQGGGTMWRRAWVDGVDHHAWGDDDVPYRLSQDSGVGLLIQGTRDWKDYTVSSMVVPHMARGAGIGARVQGMRRYYALLLASEGRAQLVKALDGDTVLAETSFPWQLDGQYTMAITVAGNRISASIDGRPLFDIKDTDRPLTGGGIALIAQEGHVEYGNVRVGPAI